MAKLHVSTSTLPTQADLLVPPGWYTATINGVELKPTKAGGQMLVVNYRITGPTETNFKVYQNLNIKNNNEKAEKMAAVSLRNILIATGIDGIEDTDELIGLDLDIQVIIKKGNEGYQDSNDVKNVRALSSVSLGNWE